MLDPESTKTSSLLRAEAILAQIPFSNLRKLFMSPLDGTTEVELNSSEFIKKFHQHIDGGVHERDLRDLFARVDANANDEMSFFELIMYIQLGTAGHRTMEDEKINQKFVEITDFPPKRNTQFHKEIITRLIYDCSRQKIYSASLDGHVKVWHSTTLKYERTLHHHTDKSACITDMTVTPDWVELVVADVGRHIYVYNLTIMQLDRVYRGKRKPIQGKPEVFRKKKPPLENQKLKHRIYSEVNGGTRFHTSTHKPTYEMPVYVLEKMDTVIVQLSTYYNKKTDKTLLYTACEDGYIRMFDLNPHVASDLATVANSGHSTMTQDGGAGVAGGSTQSNSIHPLKKSSAPFEGWISRLLVATNIHLLIAVSWDTTIKLFSLETLKLVRTLHGHKEPIYSAAYSPELKLLCTVGREKTLILWNPFISSPLQLLEGHQFPVVDVVFNAKDKQIISLGVDKTIKVWDIAMFRCIQTFKEKQQFHPEDKLAVMLFDSLEDKLITGSTHLHSYDMQRKRALFRADYLGHIHPIRSVLYNPKYHQAIVADSMFIFAWDCITGALIFKYRVEGEIVSACLDDRQRRVIVSTADGTVSMYNYINGQQLKDLKNDHTSAKEVTALRHVSVPSQSQRMVVGGGMERKLLIWNDLSEDFEERIVRKIPEEIKLESSILCFEHFRDTMIVGEENGNVSLVVLTGFIRAVRPFEESLGIEFGHGKLVCYVACGGDDTGLLNHSQPSQSQSSGFWLGDDRTQHSTTQSDLVIAPHTQPHHMVSLPVSLCTTHKQVEDILVLPRIDPICVTCYANGVVTFWNAINLTHLHSFVAHPQFESINCMCSDSDNQTLICGAADGSVLMYDLARIVTHPSKKPHISLEHISFLSQHRVHSKVVTSICCIYSSQLILSGSEDCTVSIMNRQGQQIGFFGQSYLWNISKPETFGKCSLADLLTSTIVGANFGLQRTDSATWLNEHAKSSPALEEQDEHQPQDNVGAHNNDTVLLPTIQHTSSKSDESIRTMSPSTLAQKLRNTLAPDETKKRLGQKEETLTNLEDQVDALLSQHITEMYDNLETQYQVLPSEVQSSERLRRGIQQVEDVSPRDKALFRKQFDARNYAARLNTFRSMEKVDLPANMRFEE